MRSVVCLHQMPGRTFLRFLLWCSLLLMLIEENKPLAPFTTFGIGGPARWFVEATSEEEIAETAAWAGEHGVALFVMGGGSNLLVSDAGFQGLVLRMALRGITAIDALCNQTGPETTNPKSQSGSRIYQVAAGESWDDFVELTVRENCAGVECLAGIPGTVGGTPVQNVGAYGQDAASVIEKVRAFDLAKHSFIEFTNSECGFAYRRSRFNSEDCGRYVVTRVDYRLTPGGAPTIRYPDLQRAFAEGGLPSLSEVAAQVRSVRQAKGMLIVEGDPDCRSAGSFFKNPIVTDEQLLQVASVSEKAPPRFPAGQEAEHQGRAKIPAAWLIEQAGFTKGYTRGAAAISSRHTLALVNPGEAKAVDILALASEITTAIEERFGIRLEMEPVMIGF
jgi:UDP-N-acetylmuramate dehydrogenase